MQGLNKGKKTALIWAGAILAGFILCGCIVNAVAKHQLRTAVAQIPGADIQIGKIHLSLLAGNLELKHVDLSIRDTTDAGPDLEGRIKAIQLKHVHWFRLLKGEARADRLLLREPDIRLLLKAPKAEEPDSAQTQESFLKKVSLAEFRVEKGRIGLRSKADSTRVSAQDLHVSVSEIDLNFPEAVFAFNDSTYRVSVDSLDFRDALALTRYQVGHLATADAGPVEAWNLHLYNCVKPEEVAERMGKVAAMWFDVKLDTLSTSALNIPRMLNGKRVAIDHIHLAGTEATILQDDRYPPAVPYATIQEGINAVEWPLQLNHIDAHLDTFTFIWETTHVNRGAYPMHKVFVDISSVSNAPGNVMTMNVKAGRPNHSRLTMTLSTKNDKRESTKGTLKILGLEASKLDAFTRPLFGATVQANFHQMDCSFKGDKNQLDADFCMIYDHLSVKAWGDKSAPVQFVAQNSGLATFLANLLLPKANPSSPGKEPKEVEFSFTRNPMQPYPAYLVQSVTGGMLHTLLPGGKVRSSKK